MKKRIFQIFLLPTIMCALLGVGFLSTAGVAHAAPVEAHAQQAPQLSCSVLNTAFYNTSGGGLCFGNTGTWSGTAVDIYWVTTGMFTVTWKWQGCDGSFHTTTKGPFTTTNAQNSPNRFAGCSSMTNVYSVSRS